MAKYFFVDAFLGFLDFIKCMVIFLVSLSLKEFLVLFVGVKVCFFVVFYGYVFL